jgi:hypothetical protein
MKVQRIVLANNAEMNSKIWTDKEDQRLMYLIDKMGENRWSQIASIISSKSPKQTFYRYKHLKREQTRNKNWTSEEDTFLIKNTNSITKWKVVQSQFVKTFGKYVPVFVLKSRKHCLNGKNKIVQEKSKLGHSSTDFLNDFTYTGNKRSFTDTNVDMNAYKNHLKPTNMVKYNHLLLGPPSNSSDFCKLPTNVTTSDIVTKENKSKYFEELMKLQEIQDSMAFEPEKKIIQEYYNPVEEDSYMKEAKKRPFIITKVPKHIKHSYSLKEHIKSLKNNNDQLVNINYLLINTINKLLEEEKHALETLERTEDYFKHPLRLSDNTHTNNHISLKALEEREHDITSMSTRPDIFRTLSDIPQINQNKSLANTNLPKANKEAFTLTSKDLQCFSNHWCWKMYLSIEKFMSSELVGMMSSVEKSISDRITSKLFS